MAWFFYWARLNLAYLVARAAFALPIVQPVDLGSEEMTTAARLRALLGSPGAVSRAVQGAPRGSRRDVWWMFVTMAVRGGRRRTLARLALVGIKLVIWRWPRGRSR